MSLRKNETLTGWTLLQHICLHFWAWLLNTIAITPKSEDKYVVKVFNWSEVHLSEMTCYKIHTLEALTFRNEYQNCIAILLMTLGQFLKTIRQIETTLLSIFNTFQRKRHFPLFLLNVGLSVGSSLKQFLWGH